MCTRMHTYAYPPDTEVLTSTHPYTTPTQAVTFHQSTLGIGALYRFNKHIRVQAYYEFNFNEKSKFVKGYEKDRKDDVFTLRLQYKF